MATKPTARIRIKPDAIGLLYNAGIDESWARKMVGNIFDAEKDSVDWWKITLDAMRLSIPSSAIEIIEGPRSERTPEEQIEWLHGHAVLSSSFGIPSSPQADDFWQTVKNVCTMARKQIQQKETQSCKP